MTKEDPTQHWPQSWRQDFAQQNADQRAHGEEELSPGEYLQCRYDDTWEMREQDETIRAQRHHEVFRDMLQVLATSLHDSGSYDDDVAEARRLADLAYPKPEAKP